MDKLKDFIGHLQSSDDNNFTSAAATLLSMVSDKVSSYYLLLYEVHVELIPYIWFLTLVLFN